jgi:hypothetical protein
MDEAFRASEKVLKKAAADKQVPWCSICLVTAILCCHTLVLCGNLETASAFSDIGVSTGGWSGVGLELARSLEHELESVLKEIAHQLTVAIGRIMAVQDVIDLVTGYQARSIDTIISSSATKSLLLLESHGIMDNAHLDGVAGLVTKSMSSSVEKLAGSIRDQIKALLDKLKPALIQVGKFIIKFGDKVQAIIESFSVTLDRVQKVFDQVMASMSSGGSNEALMLHQTFHMFDAMNTGVVTTEGLQDVGHIYDVPALQGKKSHALVVKYDADKSGDLDHDEFLNLVHGGDIPNLLSVVLRSFAKSLAKVAGQVGGAKFRAEIASETCDYLELMTAKNHTKVDWISDHLGNGSLPLPFVSGVLITLALKVDDPNTHKTVPTGAYVVNQIMKLHPKGFAKAFDNACNEAFFVSQGYSPDMFASVVKRLTHWSTMKNPYEGMALTQVPEALQLLDAQGSGDAAVGANGGLDVNAPTMMVERNLVETMEDMAYKVADDSMRKYLNSIEAEHRKLNDYTYGSETARFLLMHMMGGRSASQGKKHATDPAVAATKSQIPALPATLQFAKWLSWNATHTAKLFNEWSFKYQKTSSNAIDSFATQVQSMVKKIQGFIKMMMKYSTPEGIDQLENTLIDFAEAQMKAMLIVTKQRITNVVNDSPHRVAAKDGASLATKIDRVLANEESHHLPASLRDELVKALQSDAKDISETELHKEITMLMQTLVETSHSSVSKSLDETVGNPAFVHIEVGAGLKDLHQAGFGAAEPEFIAELEKDVHTSLQNAQLLQTEIKVAEEQPVNDLGQLVEDAVALLHALTHALPQASKALIFAKKEVSMLSKTLENIFKTFEKKGPELFDEIDYYYAKIWTMYWWMMITLPLSLLFYAFWSGGFFGGPGAKVDPPRQRRPNALAKICGCIEDCCRVCCKCHEYQGYGGAECCFWSVCLFLQFVVLILFVMAIIITIIAAIQFFLASGCAQIYLLGDPSICGTVLRNLRLFLDTIFPGLVDFPTHCMDKNLLTCELIGHKMKVSAEYTVLGSFLAAFFTFQLIIESGQLHSRALTRFRFESEWNKRKEEDEKNDEKKDDKENEKKD